MSEDLTDKIMEKSQNKEATYELVNTDFIFQTVLYNQPGTLFEQGVYSSAT